MNEILEMKLFCFYFKQQQRVLVNQCTEALVVFSLRSNLLPVMSPLIPDYNTSSLLLPFPPLNG